MCLARTHPSTTIPQNLFFSSNTKSCHTNLLFYVVMASSSSSQDFSTMENGSSRGAINKFRRTVHSLSSASLRKKSDISLISRVQIGFLRSLLTNIQEVVLGTKLFVLFPAVPLAIVAHYCNFGQAWVFIISLLALTPLAERVSFLTEQIAFYTGPTVGGLLNATCGNATELIIGLFALFQGKIDVVKYSLLGSILSNLLLVLGTSLFFGGIANIKKEQKYNRKQADVNILLLLMGLLCHVLPLMVHYLSSSNGVTANPNSLQMSRAISLVMLVAYVTYLFFQLKTHRHFFEAQQEDVDEDDVDTEEPVIGFWSAFAWLVGMTVLIALLSEFVVGTIEDASSSWGISVSFLSIILLPIVGNAAEHAGAIIFAFKDKLDISLGVALGSATQISIFVVPLTITVAWIGGIEMDLNFNLLETGSLALSILATAFTLQDGTSHYMKGLVLMFCYIVISLCFFFLKTPLELTHLFSIDSQAASGGAFTV